MSWDVEFDVALYCGLPKKTFSAPLGKKDFITTTRDSFRDSPRHNLKLFDIMRS